MEFNFILLFSTFPKAGGYSVKFLFIHYSFSFQTRMSQFYVREKRGSTKIGGMATLVIFVTSNMIVLIKKGNGIYTVTVTRADGVEAHEKMVSIVCSLNIMIICRSINYYYILAWFYTSVCYTLVHSLYYNTFHRSRIRVKIVLALIDREQTNVRNR